MFKFNQDNRILLGLLEGIDDGHIYAYFAEIEVREERYGRKNEFSATFDTNRAFTEDSVDVYELAEGWYDSSDNEGKLELLERFDCSPSEIATMLTRESEVRDFVDCSIYPEEFITFDENGDLRTIYFESLCCGQHDIREEFAEHRWVQRCVSQEELRNLLFLWDNYHLRELPQEELDKLVKFECFNHEDGYAESVIKDFIDEHFGEYDFDFR